MAATSATNPEHSIGKQPSNGWLTVILAPFDGERSPYDQLTGKVFELVREQTHIGRTDDNDIVIVHRSVSRNHAKFTRDAETGRYRITNLQATNGVQVNGEDQTTIELKDGDFVDLGEIRMRFEFREDIDDDAESPASVEHLLIVGKEPVVQRGEFIQVGRVAFRVAEVREYALRGANLPLQEGRLLQAAIAMFVIVAAEESVAPTT